MHFRMFFEYTIESIQCKVSAYFLQTDTDHDKHGLMDLVLIIFFIYLL